MSDARARDLAATTTLRLSVLGSVQTARFGAAIEAYGIKPKQAGVLMILNAFGPTPQNEIARTMNVAPSLIVALADHLEDLGAIERTRDPADRRRQNLAITDAGRALLAKCTTKARRLDTDLLADLSASERRVLERILGKLGHAEGLPDPDQ